MHHFTKATDDLLDGEAIVSREDVRL